MQYQLEINALGRPVAARENVRWHNASTEVTTSFAAVILLHGAKYVNQ